MVTWPWILLAVASALAVALAVAVVRLRDARRRIEALRATLPGALYRCVGGWELGRLTELSESIRDIAGQDAAELRNRRSLAHLVHPEDAVRVAEAHEEAARRGGAYMLEFRVVRPDGATRWVLESARVSGGGLEFQGILIDITDRKIAEAIAEEITAAGGRLKKDFLAMVSHEFRTPLTSVLGFAELLEASELDDKQLGFVGAIHDAGQILLALISDILDFSRIEAGKLTLELLPFWMTSAAEEVVAILRVEAERKGIDVSIVPWGEHAAFADPARVRQILLNLLGNAIKFSPDTSRIIVEIREVEGEIPREACVEVSVLDRGIGISEATSSSIFQPFVQADNSASRRHGGVGLGLAISKHLVELMGGRLRFESEPGVGSRFWFTLPKADEAEPRIERARRPVPRPRSRRNSRSPSGSGRTLGGAPRVLLAEDNPTNALLVENMLRKLGCEVDHAKNGHDAVRLVLDRSYAFVLMDCQMPELDGYDATRQIRASESLVRTPIVALTANAMPNDRAACEQAGMDEYLQKPIRKEELQRIIQRFV